MPCAFLTGVTGQDASYLAELLLSKGYEVHGLMRYVSVFTTQRVEGIFDHPRFTLHYGDLCDAVRMSELLQKIDPKEIYHLGAPSHVGVSFHCPSWTAQSIAVATANLLAIWKQTCPHARFYHASTSEMFGNALAPQSETTAFDPQSPYACAKVYAHHLTRHYRKAYDFHASCGILFNHESPRRGERFVTRKISRGVARIKHGLEDRLALGLLTPMRDWGWAPDYVEAMWMMLQELQPDDYVIATGESHHVGEFVEIAFHHVGLDWHNHITENERYLRPTEVFELRGDSSKAREALDWKPTVGFEEIVKRMVDADMVVAEKEAG